MKKDKIISFSADNIKDKKALRTSQLTLMKIAEKSITRGEYDTAIELYSKLLSVPKLKSNIKIKIENNIEEVMEYIKGKKVHHRKEKSTASPSNIERPSPVDHLDQDEDYSDESFPSAEEERLTSPLSAEDYKKAEEIEDSKGINFDDIALDDVVLEGIKLKGVKLKGLNKVFLSKALDYAVKKITENVETLLAQKGMSSKAPSQLYAQLEEPIEFLPDSSVMSDEVIADAVNHAVERVTDSVSDILGTEPIDKHEVTRQREKKIKNQVEIYNKIKQIESSSDDTFQTSVDDSDMILSLDLLNKFSRFKMDRYRDSIAAIAESTFNQMASQLPKIEPISQSKIQESLANIQASQSQSTEGFESTVKDDIKLDEDYIKRMQKLQLDALEGSIHSLSNQHFQVPLVTQPIYIPQPQMPIYSPPPMMPQQQVPEVMPNEGSSPTPQAPVDQQQQLPPQQPPQFQMETPVQPPVFPQYPVQPPIYAQPQIIQQIQPIQYIQQPIKLNIEDDDIGKMIQGEVDRVVSDVSDVKAKITFEQPIQFVPKPMEGKIVDEVGEYIQSDIDSVVKQVAELKEMIRKEESEISEIFLSKVKDRLEHLERNYTSLSSKVDNIDNVDVEKIEKIVSELKKYDGLKDFKAERDKTDTSKDWDEEDSYREHDEPVKAHKKEKAEKEKIDYPKSFEKEDYSSEPTKSAKAPRKEIEEDDHIDRQPEKAEKMGDSKIESKDDNISQLLDKDILSKISSTDPEVKGKIDQLLNMLLEERLKKPKAETLTLDDLDDGLETFEAEEETIVKKKEIKPPLPKLNFYPDTEMDVEDEIGNKTDFLKEEDMYNEPYEDKISKDDIRKEEGRKFKESPIDPRFTPLPYNVENDYKHKEGSFVDEEGRPIRNAPQQQQQQFIPSTIQAPIVIQGEQHQERYYPQKLRRKPIRLTYDFKTMFRNPYYIKYKAMLNEAATLVSEKRLDEALEYYYTIIDQNIPQAFKLMITQNIDDIHRTIVETFKFSDTIVKMEDSGNVKRLRVEEHIEEIQPTQFQEISFVED